MGEQNIVTKFTVQDQLTPTLRLLHEGLGKLASQVQQTAKAQTQLGTATQQLAQAQAHATRSTEQLTTAQKEAGQGVTGFMGVLQAARGGLGLFGGALSVAALVNFGKSIIDTGVKVEQLRRSLAAITGSTRAGQQEFTFVTETANRLGLNLVTLAESYRGLAAATRGTELAGRDTQALFVALATASRTYGLSTEQTGRALLAFQQIISKGKVTQEELRGQLAEALPGASQITARAFGVTTQALDAMVEKGLNAFDFTRRFTAQLEKEAPEATAQAGQGFVKLGNELVLMKDRIANSGLLQLLSDLAKAGAAILEVDRKIVEQRERSLGGPLPRLPETGGVGADLIQRQKELERLRRVYDTLQQRQTARFELFRPGEAAVEAARKAYEDLRAIQNKALAERQHRRQAEPDFPGGMVDPLGAAEDKIRLALEKGRTELQAIGLDPLLSDLDKAEARLKSWEETLKAIRGEVEKLSVPLRELLQGGTSGVPRSPFRAIIERESARRGIDPNLVEALQFVESTHNPQARNPRSSAKGLGQFVDDTWKKYGPPGQQFDPEANTRATVDYMADLLKNSRGNVREALTAYGDKNTVARVMALYGSQGSGGTAPTSALGGVLAEATAQEKTLRAEVARQQAAVTVGRKMDQSLVAWRQENWRDLDIFGLTLSPEQEEALKKAAKEQHERIKKFAEDLDIFELELSPEQEKRRAFTTKLADALRLGRTPREERPETKLRAEAEREGFTLTPAEEFELGLLTAEEQAKKQAADLKALYQDVAQDIGQSLSGAFTAAFANGTVSAQAFAQSLLQGLQQTFARISQQILSELINKIVAPKESQSSSALSTLIGVGIKAVGAYFGGGGGVSASSAAGLSGEGALFGSNLAQGGIVPAMTSMGRYSRTFAGLKPLALANGGIIRQPTFALMGEEPGKYEAVVPLSGNRAIPVEMRQQGHGASSQGQPIIIQLHQDFSGSIDPRTLRTPPSEIIAVTSRDISQDGVLRRVIVQHTR